MLFRSRVGTGRGIGCLKFWKAEIKPNLKDLLLRSESKISSIDGRFVEIIATNILKVGSVRIAKFQKKF